MSVSPNFSNYHFILASQSPRRQYLLKELGLDFEIRVQDVDESFPPELKAQHIPLYLCEKKANAYTPLLKNNSIVITADTIVWINNRVLNKPKNNTEAVQMLQLLSDNIHEVFTGVCLRSKNKITTFYSASKVYFRKLALKEIEYYVLNFKPFDKAGSYGAQECMRTDSPPCSAEESAFLAAIGKSGLNKIDSSRSVHTETGKHFITHIEGSYFNVMGFPLKEFYESFNRDNASEFSKPF
ncbi:MAG: septum formation protein Maf [Bacteroidia bacterium]|nr:septum formation protein Maf [Bacteroidia bacterium]